MGWASAGDIFNAVARALVDADWDTEDESLDEFASEPAVVAAFADHGIHLPDPDEDD